MLHAWSRLPLPAMVAAASLAAGAIGCGADLVLPPDPVTLTVSGSGSGSGLVATASGVSPILKCSILEGAADTGSCSAIYAVGTRLTLSAAPADGSLFSGWSGACTGTAASLISLADSARVVATFQVARFTLTVIGAGTGSGTVRSATGGLPVINCSITSGQSAATGCAGDFLVSGNHLTLTASAPITSTFSGWGGDCSGTGSCSVLLDRDRLVSAAFVLRR
jgi:hypothetical protein